MSEAVLAEVLLWGACAALAFTFAGYPALIGALAARRPPVRPPPAPAVWPTVDCLVVAHNEAPRIAGRVRNLLASDYPPGRLRVIVVCDGSTDGTAAAARAVADGRVSVVELPERRGKAAGLNAGLAVAAAEVVVLADARQRFAPGAVRALARHFGDPQVGAVSGNYSLQAPADGVGAGVDAYWRLEKFIRAAESRYDSSIGCTGAIYAIRRAWFTPLPADTILDDVVIPMRLALAGRRVLFAPDALAWEAEPVAAGREFVRKRRTLAGNFQMLFRHPAWLLPWRNRLWWQLAAHKYLRLLAPVWLVLALAANGVLAGHSAFYLGLFAVQAGAYGLACVGLLRPQWRGRLFTLPAGFVFLNAATVAGFWHYCRRPSAVGWEQAAANPPAHVQGAR